MHCLSFQRSFNIPAPHCCSRPSQASFQRSFNIPAPHCCSRPSQALRRSSMVRSCLNLDDLRLTASRLEDRIVFTLLERTIYSYNRYWYSIDDSLDYKSEGGMLRKVVTKMEQLQAAFGGFKVPEEVPFFPDNLPEECSDPDVAAASPPLVLDPFAASLNINSKLWSLYNIVILKSLDLKVVNDGRQGSALSCDASCIQAISRRVHWGKFLAEAKFQLSPNKFKEAVRGQDMKLLNDALMCHEHRDAAAKRYVDMANAAGDKRLAFAANVCLCLILPFAEEMEKDYIVAKLSADMKP